jgi:cytochrome c-type biogenesis protein CcmH
MKQVLSVLLLALFCHGPSGFAASAVEVHVFDDPALEARYYALIDELRCPKCQNTNLAGSDAPIAHDLRGTVYRLLTEKDMSDGDIRQYLVERYGDFVLYDPPFRPGTAALWLLPLLALGIGYLTVRRFTKKPELDTLTLEERKRLAELEQDS